MNNKNLIFIFSVIAVLLLGFFIFNSDFPTSAFISLAGAETCEGTCIACDTFPIQATCEFQDGCAWSISACTGTPIACKDLLFEDCSTHGCSWNESAGKCQGTPETCPTYNSNENLCNSGGCVWSAADCSGVCTVCTDFLAQGTCETQDGCSWDPGIVCGDNIKEGTEICDGTDLDSETCITQGFTAGTLACQWDCLSFDTSGCTICSNNTKETGETCDGTDLDEETCVSQGFDAGILACQANCSAFDTSSCTFDTVCGNDTKEGTEVCDGPDLDGETCASQGYDNGTLSCSSDCSVFNTTNCTSDTDCGNGIKDTGEVCDGSDFGGETCVTQGYKSGSLFCFWDCLKLDTSSCSNSEPIFGPVDCGDECCGNGLCEENENENFTTCKTDCPNPKVISFNFHSPIDGEKFTMGETIIVKVEITADSSVPLSSDVEWVKLTGFFGTEDLYDDGLHNDGAERDLIYGNSFFIDNDVDAIEHTLTVEAKVAELQQGANIKIIVEPVLDAELLTDKDSTNSESLITGSAISPLNVSDTGFEGFTLLLMLLITIILFIISMILSGVILYYLRWKKKGFVPFPKVVQKIKNKFNSVKYSQNSNFLRK